MSEQVPVHGPAMEPQKRPTETKREVFEDASRILEELLQRQHDPRTAGRRHTPHHRLTSKNKVDDIADIGHNDRRSHTLPPRLKGLLKDGARVPTDFRERNGETDRQNFSDVSSADTEGDSAAVSEHRKKKGLLKKARDRFLHAFHRQEREKRSRKESQKGQQPQSPSKGKKKNDRHAEDLKGSGDFREKEITDDKIKSQSPQQKSDGLKKKNSLLSSLRQSFRTNSRKNDGGQKSTSTASSKSSASPDKEFQIHTPGASNTLEVLHHYGRKGSAASGPGKSPSPFPHSTSTDTQYNDTSGNKSSSLYSFTSAHTRNALDNPDDDIQFMDDGDHNVQGLLLGAFGNRNSRYLRGIKVELMRNSSLDIDGDTDVPDGKSSKHFGQTKGKDEMYEKIAHRIAKIGDNYAAESGLSDAEGNPIRPAPLSAQGGLTDFEKDVMECLRELGDRYSSKVETEVKEETYKRFKETVQHSLGHEISWNQLAILFYTTKGVVSAVGKGSRVASYAKEMTLQYFSEKFADWIMDRGGFDSVMSESESELD